MKTKGVRIIMLTLIISALNPLFALDFQEEEKNLPFMPAFRTLEPTHP